MKIFKIISLISEGSKKIEKIRADGKITVDELIDLVRWALVKLEVSNIVLIKEDGKQIGLV